MYAGIFGEDGQKGTCVDGDARVLRAGDCLACIMARRAPLPVVMASLCTRRPHGPLFLNGRSVKTALVVVTEGKGFACQQQPVVSR